MTTEGLPSWRYEEGGTTGSWEGGDVGSPASGFVIHAASGEGPDAHTHPAPVVGDAAEPSPVLTDQPQPSPDDDVARPERPTAAGQGRPS